MDAARRQPLVRHKRDQKGDLQLKSAGPEYAQATVAGAFELVGTNIRLLSIVRQKRRPTRLAAAAVAGAMQRAAPPRSEPGKA